MDEPFLVAAIDIGTTYSGYAYSFRTEYLRNRLKIYTPQWTSLTTVTTKTPSTLLLTPEKTFHSFGYEAEEKFSSLAETGDHRNWFYFRRFKMILYENESLNFDTMMKDENNHKMPALKIFSMAINYLRGRLIEEVKAAVESFVEDEVRWVLTVPAIWDLRAKQFMRRAAQEAGIKEKQLLLALEPEAASIYCNELSLELSQKKNGAMMSFCKGTKYMVLDLGGGTADCTVHEITKNETLREIYKSTGGPAGGTRVDEAFKQFLIKLFGSDVLNNFRDTYFEDYILLLHEFEIKKRKVHPNLEEEITLKIPHGLTKLFFEHTGDTLEQILSQTAFSNTCRSKADKLRIDPIIFKDFFSDVIKDITNYTLDILNKCEKNIDKILLVGGFSESQMVFNAIREKFPNNEISRPKECGHAVLNGAVLFGHYPDILCSRVCRFTYGHEVFKPFDPRIHPESYKVKRPDGRVMCGKLFKKYVEIDSHVPTGHKICNSFVPSDEDATTGIRMYQSTSKNPEFITDPGCSFLGSIIIRKPARGWTKNAKVHVSMEFGRTEFSVYIQDECLQETYCASYDFLR